MSKKSGKFPAFLCFSRLLVVAVGVLTIAAGLANAGEVRVAVAANFTQAAKDIGLAFEQETGHDAILSFGSTGQLYTQITQQAPFDVFLAADQIRPKLAVDEGLAAADSLFTYATGRIALFSKDRDLVKGEATLSKAKFSKIAIANPLTAPYGAAAMEVMTKLGVDEILRTRIVRGNNIAQTFQFVETGNAELGFVALSQITAHAEGSRWVIPQELYAMISQDAVLLEKAADNPAAIAFMRFLKGDSAKAVMTKYGYGAEGGAAG